MSHCQITKQNHNIKTAKSQMFGIESSQNYIHEEI
jgi:hypothetical protein